MRANHYAVAIRDLDRFLVAFNDLCAVLESHGGYGSRFATYRAKRGLEQRAERLYPEVAHLAGPAAEAMDVAGVYMDYKPPGTMSTKPVNPMLLWSTIFDDMPMLDPQLVLTVGQQALGLLQHRYEVQLDRQRGLVGALGWFFTLAPRVREAAGLPPHSVRGGLVTTITATAQALLVTTVGGVLVYPLAKWLGWIP